MSLHHLLQVKWDGAFCHFHAKMVLICTVIKTLNTNSPHIWWWLVVSAISLEQTAAGADYHQWPWNDLPEGSSSPLSPQLSCCTTKHILLIFFPLQFCAIKWKEFAMPPADYTVLNEPEFMTFYKTVAWLGILCCLSGEHPLTVTWWDNHDENINKLPVFSCGTDSMNRAQLHIFSF